MIKEISIYYKNEDLKERAVVRFDTETTEFYVDYYDKNQNVFYTEFFEGKSVHFIEDAAENWALGIKKLDGKMKQGSLL